MGFKLKKILARVGIILVALIAVLFIIRAVFNYSAGRRLENFLEQMRTEGIPLTLKDIEPDCDPRKNAALDWKKAKASLSVEREQRELFGQVIDDFFINNPLGKDVIEQIHELASENQEAIHFMLEASDKSCFKSQDDWMDYDYDLEVKNLIQMIQGTRLLGIDAVMKAEEGHLEEAINQCLSVRRFLKLHLQEPFLINYLVNMACIKQVMVCLNYIVSKREIETETLEKILRKWDASPWTEELEWKLRSEKISSIGASLLYLKGEIDTDWLGGNELNYWIFRPIYKNEVIWIPKVFDRLIETVKMPYYQSRDSKELEKILDGIPWYYKRVKMMPPNLGALLLKRATLNALVETARIGMACKIYKNINGDYPDKLSELSPEIMKEIPMDPFTGKSYVYRKGDAGFIVYSVGSNQKDDGGRGTWSITQMVMEKDDDWAWAVNFNPTD